MPPTLPKSSKHRIFWAPSENKYAVKIPPGGQAFINDINLFCTDLQWRADRKLFLVGENDLNDIADLIRSHFNVEPEIDYKPSSNGSGATGNAIEINAANAAALNMFKVAGPQAAKKMYYYLIKEFHPDTGSTPDHNKAAEITISYTAIKAALGWS